MYSRTCTSCRSRKVKCDRQRPCGGCTRTGTDCIYPAGPGRAPKQPRRFVDQKILDRVSHLEQLVKSAAIQPQIQQPETSTNEPENQHEKNVQAGSDPLDQQFGRLVIDDKRSAYVSNVLWASLSDEVVEISLTTNGYKVLIQSQVEELRDLLNQQEVDENLSNEESDPFHLLDDSSESAAILGLQRTETSLHAYHPPLSQAVTLFETFKANVEPMVHIFHMPTLEPTCWNAFSSPERLDHDTETLLFAIYYSSVISLETQECEAILGVPRTIALKHYRFAMQQAMARANILNTQSILLLQAVVLFLSALRNEDASRTCWSLTALVFNSARAMGLHRDGTGFGLSPLETEIRRRLWWNICLLDIRSSEYHGFEPIAHESMFNTRMPLNINDCDIRAEMTDPPVEAEGATEMTFSLIRCEVMRVGWKIGYVNFQNQGTETPSFSSKISLVRDMQNTLEQKYLKHCTGGSSLFEVCETVVRLTIARTWLVLYCPLSQPRSSNEATAGIKDWLFATSLRVLELTTKLLTDPLIAQWRWHSKTHVQWHAAVFALSEICSRPPSDECDRAWGYVQTLYSIWKEKCNKGNIWIPIKRLMAKAQQIREMQDANRSSDSTAGIHFSDSLLNISPETHESSDGPSTNSHEASPPLMGSLDRILELTPGGLAGLDDILCQTGAFDVETMINSYVDFSGDPGGNLPQWQFGEH